MRLRSSLFLALLAACGGKKEAVQSPAGASASVRDAGTALAAPAPLPPLKTHLVAVIGEKSLGPFLAMSEARGMAAYVASFEAGSKRVVAIPLGPSGVPSGTAETLANVSEDVNSLVVRPLKGNAGFVVLWTTLTERGEALFSMILGEDGKAKGPAAELARTTNDIVWSEAVATDRGAMITWAEETREGTATVFSVALDATGKSRHVAGRVARRAAGWQVVGTGAGAFLIVQSVPTDAAATKANAPAPRLLQLQAIDENGQPKGDPLTLAKAEAIAGDVEVGFAFGKWFVAWVQKAKDVRSIQLASFDDKGAIALSPKRVLDGGNDLGLVALKGSASSLVLAWEDAARVGTKRVFVGKISPAGSLEVKPVGFLARGRGTPEVALVGDEISVLASMSACDSNGTDCDESVELPTFLRYDATLRLVQRDSISIEGSPAVMGWGLGCRSTSVCVGLVASKGNPADVHTASLVSRANVSAPKEALPPPADAPRLGKAIPLSSGETIADIASVTTETGAIVATLSSALDDPGHPLKGATLTTRFFADGKVSEAQIISPRALSVGGVALARSDRNDGGAVMAWVARENGDPEVHLSRLDRRGKRTNDVLLTTSKGDASHVAIVRVDTGFFVAWVDGRSGNGEVFATKVNSDLVRVVREEKITNAPGDASDLTLALTKNTVWAAWADPRESPDDGFADIYLAALEPHDAKKRFDEIRVVASAPNSRSPELVATDTAVTVGWIEEAPLGTSADHSIQYGAMIATFDAAGKAKIAPTRVKPTAPGIIANVALELAPSGDVRGVVSRAGRESLWLDTVAIGTASSQSFPLVELHAPPTFDGPLFLANGRLFYADDGPTPQDRRVNIAEIDWKP